MSRLWEEDRNAEALRTQSCCPSTSSALSASPRFKTEHGHVLTPGRYVGAEKMERLPRELATQFHLEYESHSAIVTTPL